MVVDIGSVIRRHAWFGLVCSGLYLLLELAVVSVGGLWDFQLNNAEYRDGCVRLYASARVCVCTRVSCESIFKNQVVGRILAGSFAGLGMITWYNQSAVWVALCIQKLKGYRAALLLAHVVLFIRVPRF